MSTVIVPNADSIAMDNRRSVQFIAVFFASFGRRIRAVSDLMERRFAEFAGVPYQDPLIRQQWEDLWENESEPNSRVPWGPHSRSGETPVSRHVQ